ATDHAPHTREEKNNSYFNAPSGGPMVQHALVAMLEAMHQGRITIDRVVEKMSHAPAVCFELENRGFLRKGYHADLALVRLNDPWTVTPESLLYKCGWSPMEGETFRSRIIHTLVNGKVAYSNTNGLGVGTVLEDHRGQRLLFQR
ncbi:MAG: amidohydrolase family protein, partial [Bacteroidota bacterium]